MTELFAHRFYWNVGTVGDGNGYSVKFSVKMLFEPREWWFGVSWMPKDDEHRFVFVGVPMLHFRFHYVRSYGGRYR